jgi:hypothetical protein
MHTKLWLEDLMDRDGLTRSKDFQHNSNEESLSITGNY